MFTSSSRCTFLILFLATTSSGHDLDTCSISGNALDLLSAPIQDAEVVATFISTDARRITYTNSSGAFQFSQLQPGSYTVSVIALGFAPQTKQVSLVASQNSKLKFTLEPASIVVDPITVTTTESTNVDTTRTVVGGTIAEQELDSLPVFSRSPLDLIFTLPGVTEEPLTTRDLADDRETTYSRTPEEAGTFS